MIPHLYFTFFVPISISTIYIHLGVHPLLASICTEERRHVISAGVYISSIVSTISLQDIYSGNSGIRSLLRRTETASRLEWLGGGILGLSLSGFTAERGGA